MANDKILSWAKERLEWQQDALRRIAISSELYDKDVSKIFSNLKASKGLEEESKNHDDLEVENETCVPLTANHLKPDGDNAPLAYLCSVSNISNVNQLAPDQILKFALDGLTLIYGHNGSGKSGYCRILKKICRSVVKDPIHPNVYGKGIQESTEAKITYKLANNDEKKEVRWCDGKDEYEDHLHLSVFDNHNSRLYVDKKNRIDYLPYEIELLTRFADLLNLLNEKLRSEINAKEKSLNVLPNGFKHETAVSKLVDQLSKEVSLEKLPSNEQILTLGNWNDEHANQLKKLQENIGKDPKTLAQNNRSILSIVGKFITEFKEARETLSETKIKEIKQAIDHAKLTAKNASSAATELFKNEPLSRVGSNPWQQMFYHAKEYSKLVYKEVQPPVTDDGALCVLCQQSLDEEAADRLRRFENYVVGQVKKDAETAATNLEKKLESVKNLQISTLDLNKSLLDLYTGLSDEIAKTINKIKEFSHHLTTRKKKIPLLVGTGDTNEIESLNFTIIDELQIVQEKLKEEVKYYESLAKNETNRVNLKEQLDELLDRKKLSENLTIIQARRDSLEELAKLKACQNELETKDVSIKINQRRKILVSEGLKNRISKEIIELDLTHIPLSINQNTIKGESKFSVNLETQKKVSNSDVLSEGEQRALGLACFIADVEGQPKKHGIIVDDPVSSLDHIRLRLVAERLVKQAKSGRQVIVFTHNLLFYSEVMSFAAEQEVPIFKNVISMEEDKGFGVVKADVPWEAKSIKDRIKQLQQKVNKLKGTNELSDDERAKVKNFYSDLRETWERLVEEVLLNKVVLRYGSDVKTLSLKGVVVENEDYKTIYLAMKRASKHSGHDTPATNNLPLPNIEEIKKDFEEIKNYKVKLRKRASKTECERKKLENPPEATTV